MNTHYLQQKRSIQNWAWKSQLGPDVKTSLTHPAVQLCPGQEDERRWVNQVHLNFFSLSHLSSLNRNVRSNSENRRHLNIRHHHQNCPGLWCLCPSQPSERVHSQGTECQLYKCKCATPYPLRTTTSHHYHCLLSIYYMPLSVFDVLHVSSHSSHITQWFIIPILQMEKPVSKGVT